MDPIDLAKSVKPITAYHGSPHAMEEDYRGQHQAPDRENGVPLHDTSGVYPPDFYGPNGFRYYANHGNDYDYRSYNAHVRLKDKPEEFVSVHRAIPSDVYKKALKEDAPLRHMIRPGDWVTPSKEYAKEHGEAQFGKNYKIASMRVKAKDVFTNGDSIHEWGYDPEIKKEDGGGITAYHGSPHDFDQFDTSKIGTGEGAQAYGHGLYFAEAEPVAEGYRDKLRRMKDEISFDDKPLKELRDYNEIQNKLENKENDWRLFKAVDEITKRQGGMDERLNELKNWYRNQPDMLSAIDRAGQRMNLKENSGHMYEVHIDAHPDHFLDWNKPLSEQSEHVQKILGGRSIFEGDKALGEVLGRAYRNELFGGDVAQMDRAKPHEVSESLARQGIKGIKYQDAGSRGAGQYDLHVMYKGKPHSDPIPMMDKAQAEHHAKEYQAKGYDTEVKPRGTHNYVVFDHNRVNVKRKYEQGGFIRRAYQKGGKVEGSIWHNKDVEYGEPTDSTIVQHALDKIAAPLPASILHQGSVTGRRH